MLITNATLVTWSEPNQLLEDSALHIKNGVISEIGSQREMVQKYPQEERLDARGQFVLPGNICAHTHFYGAFSRGMAIPGPAAADFPQILAKLWWPLDRSLTLEDVRYSALVWPCRVKMLRKNACGRRCCRAKRTVPWHPGALHAGIFVPFHAGCQFRQ